MVEQGLQVRFNPDGYFVEDLKNQCRLVAKGKRNGRMFTLVADILEVQVAMFAHGRGVIADIEIWHKRIGHLKLQRLKSMQTQSVVAGLPKFRVDGMQKVHECYASNIVHAFVIYLSRTWATRRSQIGDKGLRASLGLSIPSKGLCIKDKSFDLVFILA